jgi:putative FmdB family regulatory protein
MPLYEYCCRDCGREFEELVFSGEDEVRCPNCGSDQARKMISRCRTRMGGEIPSAKEAAGAGGGGGGCSGCGGGSCASC